MIYGISSDLSSFKNIEFNPGMNILLADKQITSTDKQTRNGAGKTSVIEIIHFLLGADCKKDSIFRNDHLINNSFSMEFDLGENRVRVTRSGSNPSRILLSGEHINELPLGSANRTVFGDTVLSNEKWITILGHEMFYKNIHNKTPPSYRSILSYFVRQEQKGGFHSPLKQTNMQQIGDQQVALSYLIGLDWGIAQKWDDVRDRIKTIKELKKASKTEAFKNILGTSAELRTQLTIADDNIRKLKDNIINFKVLPQYHALDKEASEITQKLGKLADEDIIDNVIIAELERSLKDETPPTYKEISRLYTEAGLVFPENVNKRFDDLKNFHDTIIENRRSHLVKELEDVKKRINQRNTLMNDISARQSEIMGILQSHGALEQFAKLQSELTKVEAETEALRQKYLNSVKLDEEKEKLNTERQELQNKLKQDHLERANQIDKSILLFKEISDSLYETPGYFTIDSSENGPKYDVTIQGKNGKGKRNMLIYCFDMMLMRLCAERHIGPGFLVHDSHLYDGVDGRQKAKAFFIGSEMANKYNFQYIVTMNSNDMPKDDDLNSLPSTFNLNDYVLKTRLTDATVDGGLFGIRF